MELDLAVAAADAASVLVALNKLSRRSSRAKNWRSLDRPSVPMSRFFFRVRRFLQRPGEIVNPTTLKRKLSILLLKPGFSVLSGWAYSPLAGFQRDSGNLYQPQNFDDQSFVNDLERPVFEKFVFLAQLKTWLLKQAEVGAGLMSGSGSTVFAGASRKMRMLILCHAARAKNSIVIFGPARARRFEVIEQSLARC